MTNGQKHAVNVAILSWTAVSSRRSRLWNTGTGQNSSFLSFFQLSDYNTASIRHNHLGSHD